MGAFLAPDQLAGATAACAAPAGARRQKVAASAKLTRMEANANSMNSMGNGMLPVTTYATWLATAYVPYTANHAPIQRGRPASESQTEAMSKYPAPYSNWPAP